jgi:hypothetical protein
MALTPKDPDEQINITFDYSGSNDKITEPVITVSIKGTTTDIPAMKGTPFITSDGKKVVVKIIGGTNNQYYDLKCLAKTVTTGEVLAIKDTLHVKAL